MRIAPSRARGAVGTACRLGKARQGKAHTVKVGSSTATEEAPSAAASSAWALPASRAAVTAVATALTFIVMMLD